MNIGIDIDEVLANHLEKLNEFFYQEKGKKFSEKDYSTYDWWEVWGMSKEEAEQIDKEFKKSKLFEEIKPIQGAVETLKILSKNNKLIIITSRHPEIKAETAEWFSKNFNGLSIPILHSGDFWGINKSKLDICKENNIDIMIEDHRKYAIACSREDIKVILFNKPWNQNLEHKNIIRVNNWKEAQEEIEGAKPTGQVGQESVKT